MKEKSLIKNYKTIFFYLSILFYFTLYYFILLYFYFKIIIKWIKMNLNFHIMFII